jgi:DNA-binding NarL/FixJ family response regulator
MLCAGVSALCCFIPVYAHGYPKFTCLTNVLPVCPDITGQPEYQMVYHRLKPVFFNGKLCFGICMMNISVIHKPGNLRIYFKDNRHSFDKYSFANRRWNTEPVEHLTEREILILKLSKQGLNNKEIADKLGIRYETLRHINTSICKKFNLETTGQVIVYATNHLMLFDTRKTSDTTEKNKSKKHCQKLKLTEEKLEYIQKCLDKGQSINSIAKSAGVSEGCIRKAVKSGKLLKKRQ